MVGAFAVFTLLPLLTPHMTSPCRKLSHRPVRQIKVQPTNCCIPLTGYACVDVVAGQFR